MSVWILFQGKSPVHIQNLRKKLKLGNCKVVIRDRMDTLAEVGNGHVKWAEELAHEFHHTHDQSEGPSRMIQLPCGLYVERPESVRAHTSKCKSCKSLQPEKIRKERPGGAVSLFKVPGLTEFNLPGLVNVLMARRDELLEMAQTYDSTIRAIEGVQGLEQKARQLAEERIEHAKALKFFIAEEGHTGILDQSGILENKGGKQ